MKVLVTGGAGFIGSHTVDKLLESGHEVVAIDNLSTGRFENIAHQVERVNASSSVERASVSSSKDHPRFTFIKADINDIENTFSAYQNTDWVIHLAALADIVPSIERPHDYHRSNVDGTLAVLECARKANVKKFVYGASSSCYGIPDVYPTSEEAPIKPQYPYALTKYVAEQYVLHWGQVYKLPIVSLRFFNVYGPRSRTSGTYGAVFGVFLSQKLGGKPYTIVGDGSQSRDFTYVTDVVDAIVCAAKSSTYNEVFNVGSGGHYSVNYLVELLGGGHTVHIPKRPGEPDKTFADITKIKEKLNWQPKTSFEQGVKNILAEIDYWKNAPVWTPETIKQATKTWFEYLN